MNSRLSRFLEGVINICMIQENMMNEKLQIPETRESASDVRVTRPGTPIVSPTPLQPARWSAHRRRSAWLLLVLLLLGMGTIFALSNSSSWFSRQRDGIQPDTSPALSRTRQPISPSVITAKGQFREYPLPQSDSQPMRLAIDHEGRIWFGEMGRNYLAAFDPRGQTFQQMIPPHGRNGVMSIQVAPDDTIWFVEQYANYIGHYFPTTRHYQIYPLPRLTIPDPGHAGKTLSLPSAPNELALDSHGAVWFTEFNSDTLGRLDPHTGLMQHYPLSTTRSIQTLYPYGVTVDPGGMVWFTEMSNNRIGRLDPATGRVRFFTAPGPGIPLMEIACDSHGIIWATAFSAGLLLRLDPGTGTFTRYSVPFASKGVDGLYGLLVTPTGNVWVTLLDAGALVRLDVAANQFVFYRLPVGSSPLGLVMKGNQTLWFTEGDKIGMLHPNDDDQSSKRVQNIPITSNR